MTTAEKPAPTSGLAIASLITALTCIAPAAIICGHMAMSKIKKSGGQIGGMGLAMAGTIIGYVTLIVAIVSIVPAMFVGARAWKMGSDRAACIMNQRQIEQVVRTYQDANGLSEGDPLDLEKALTDATGAPLTTTCPNGDALIISGTIPDEGDPVVTCPDPAHNLADD
jgi:hypothetical protein